MELADVYKQQVKPSTIPLLSFGTHSPIITRDPTIRALERDVFKQLRSVIPVEHIENIDLPKAPMNKHVSFEDALRELQEMNK